MDNDMDEFEKSFGLDDSTKQEESSPLKAAGALLGVITALCGGVFVLALTVWAIMRLFSA